MESSGGGGGVVERTCKDQNAMGLGSCREVRRMTGLTPDILAPSSTTFICCTTSPRKHQRFSRLGPGNDSIRRCSPSQCRSVTTDNVPQPTGPAPKLSQVPKKKGQSSRSSFPAASTLDPPHPFERHSLRLVPHRQGRGRTIIPHESMILPMNPIAESCSQVSSPRFDGSIISSFLPP